MEARKNLGIRPGDTVRVWQNITELKTQKQANKKEATVKNVRKQAFEGTVLAVKHGSEAGATFTVRRVASGVGVERNFPLYSPMIDEVEVLRRARVRRAKLYFIRRKASREARHIMRREGRSLAAPAAAAAQHPETPQTAEGAVE
ncbi:MAG: 50S ribosomal protein L19 [Patescibacteria group bacterium]|nr:50S ribosomal protein L19 [Patescibacteria group bacterium]